mmetsp:Transcript_5448/g.7925  ORF Transcript_5448/g.7925 Transcript_5448/m.7925 type:complete len:122 (-) Transcript_5448:201-566(-)
MQETMRVHGVHGNNNYKLKDLFKSKLRREGKLPSNSMCDKNVLNNDAPLPQVPTNIIEPVANQPSPATPPLIEVRTVFAETPLSQSEESYAPNAEVLPVSDIPPGAKLWSDCTLSKSVNCA